MEEQHETAPVAEDVRAGGPTEGVVEQRATDPALEFRQRRAEMLSGATERRKFAVGDMECRTLDDGTIRMSGYASVTEHSYEVGDPERGGFYETVKRNACKRTLSEDPDVILVTNHGEGGSGLPMARTKNRSLALTEDARGLRWVADLDPEDPESRVLARKVERGLLDECSFAFRVTDDDWDETYTHRTIKSLSLHRGDVSVVNHGANPATSVSVLRAFAEDIEQRASKTLSAATREELMSARDTIDNLLAKSDKSKEEPVSEAEAEAPVEAASETPSEPEAERSAASAETKAVEIPDHLTRRRERLAVLRGGKR